MPELNWIGKDKIINHHQDVPYKILEHKYGFLSEKNEQDNETNSGNMIIHGDNLEALKSLLPKFEGKIKVIYIDPPYNTGNERWVYNDNVNHPKIKKWLGQVVGKDSDDLSRHDKWLCMMYPRLKLLYKLLAEDGVLFISIDDNEHANLKLICAEIFGINNFIANVAVVNNFKGRSDDKYIATAHENLLIFHKGAFTTKGIPLPDEYMREYKEEDENGKYRLLGLRKRGSNAREIDRPNLFYPIYYCPKTYKISIKEFSDSIAITPKLSGGENGTWRWGKETLLNRINEIEIRIVKTRNEYDVFQKDYLERNGVSKRIKPKSFWQSTEFSAEAGTLELKKIFSKKIFNTPKSTFFVDHILQQSSEKDSIILDSFAGSGTTAHSVLKQNKIDGGNRKFILVEMEDYAEDITAKRVKKAIKGYGAKGKSIKGLGGSFDFYELGLPLFDQEKNLNEEVDVEKIREYIWYSETHSSYEEPKKKKETCYYLGKTEQTAFYFIYEKDRVTTLDYDFLKSIKTKTEQYLIYADNCLLPKDFMSKKNIIFKKIPRDITRF